MKKAIKGYIAKWNPKQAVSESFKSEVSDKKATFPKKLGVAHPFKFKEMQAIFNNIPFSHGAINIHADAILGDFSVKTPDANVQALIDQFIEESNLKVEMRQWITSSLVTGNGFMEIDVETPALTNIDPSTMFVKRDIHGVVKGYNQFKGRDFRNIDNGKTVNKVIPFAPNRIAHYKLDDMPGQAYGIGLNKPNETQLDMLVQNQLDNHQLIGRKAGAPMWAKVGQPGESADPETIDTMQANMEYMTNRTEWTTDGNVDLKVIDFGDVGKGHEFILKNDVQQLIFGFNVPAVLMGVDNINEGIGKVQQEAFQRRTKARREEVEEIMKDKIFKPFLEAQSKVKRDVEVDGIKTKSIGLDAPLEFVWELPGETEINNRVAQLSTLLSANTNIDENMRRLIQMELAETLGLEDTEDFLREPEIGLDDKKEEEEKVEKDEMRKAQVDKLKGPNGPEAQKEKKIKQPEVPGAKPRAKAKHEHISIKESQQMTIKDWVDLKEAKGFNYSDYLVNILSVLNKDKFTDLLAITEEQLSLGLLPQEQVNKLKTILKDGFKKNKTMLEIETDIEKNIDLKDRFILKDGNKILNQRAETRPPNIARTETVRLASKGLLKTYNDAGIKKVRWLAALSERTCPICEALNDQVFEINNTPPQPAHNMCRCSYISL